MFNRFYIINKMLLSVKIEFSARSASGLPDGYLRRLHTEKNGCSGCHGQSFPAHLSEGPSFFPGVGRPFRPRREHFHFIRGPPSSVDVYGFFSVEFMFSCRVRPRNARAVSRRSRGMSGSLRCLTFFARKREEASPFRFGRRQANPRNSLGLIPVNSWNV